MWVRATGVAARTSLTHWGCARPRHFALVSRDGTPPTFVAPTTSDGSATAFGYCRRCDVVHSLPRTAAAIEACTALLGRISAAGRLDFDSPVPVRLTGDDKHCVSRRRLTLFGIQDARFAAATKYRTAEQPRQQGQMLGILLASDKAGETHVLKAFSGQLNSVWVLPGWAPPLWQLRHDTDDGVYGMAFRRIIALGKDADEAQALLVSTPRSPANRQAVASLEQSRIRARRSQKAISAALLARIRASMEVVNARGSKTTLAQASLLGDASPGGMGDCCAPKLLSAAYAAGLRPLAMAESWFGSPPPSGERMEGRTYDACAERCQPLLGYMLCGLDETEAST